MCDVVLPAIPDFSWAHATNGEVDKDGWAIVTVQVRLLLCCWSCEQLLAMSAHRPDRQNTW